MLDKEHCGRSYLKAIPSLGDSILFEEGYKEMQALDESHYTYSHCVIPTVEL